MELNLEIMALLLGGAFFAGMLDAIVGGGGLIQIPLLFGALPGVPPGTLFGTNKISSVFGTAVAALRFSRRFPVAWRIVLPAATAAFLMSFLGAKAVTLVPTAFLRPLILGLLVFVAVYTFVRKDFGSIHRPREFGRKELIAAVLLGGLIGFYDGFFGPGAGSFLIFLFIRYFGLDFLRASATAKVVNLATNLAALAYFVPAGHLLFALGAGMAGCNVAGSLAGTQLAFRKGSGFVRKVFLAIVLLLIIKFARDTYA